MRPSCSFATEHLTRPVTGLIHTHSHVDHFGGVLGVITHEQASSGEIPVLAPRDYVDESLAENVLAGNVMGRRATYMYGNLLKPSTRGFVSTGLGAALSMGSTGFVIPNDIISETGETRTIDGIEIEFQMTIGVEYQAVDKALLLDSRCSGMSEITSITCNNSSSTPCGAQVRDARLGCTDQRVHRLFGDKLEVCSSRAHHWPI